MDTNELFLKFVNKYENKVKELKEQREIINNLLETKNKWASKITHIVILSFLYSIIVYIIFKIGYIFFTDKNLFHSQDVKNEFNVISILYFFLGTFYFCYKHIPLFCVDKKIKAETIKLDNLSQELKTVTLQSLLANLNNILAMTLAYKGTEYWEENNQERFTKEMKASHDILQNLLE